MFWFFSSAKNIYFKNKISFTAKISKYTTLRKSNIGRFTYIGSGSSLAFAKVGNYSSIGPNVVIGGMEHLDNSISTNILLKNISPVPITDIGADVWIGANVVIRAGVVIGPGAVVGSGSIVLQDVPAFSVVVGVPAKIIYARYSEEKIKSILDSHYWNYNPDKAKSILKVLQ